MARAVFAVGIILAALALSPFQDLFQQHPQLGPVQAGFLRLADIFTTGGLPGGGSAGLNAAATKATDFLNRK